MQTYVIMCQLKDDNGAVTYGALLKWLSIDGITTTLVPIDDDKAIGFTDINLAIQFWADFHLAYTHKFDIKNVYIVKRNNNEKIIQLELNGETSPVNLPSKEYYYIALLLNNGDALEWGYLGEACSWISEKNFLAYYDKNNDNIYTFDTYEDVLAFWHKYEAPIRHEFRHRLLEVKIVCFSEKSVAKII